MEGLAPLVQQRGASFVCRNSKILMSLACGDLRSAGPESVRGCALIGSIKPAGKNASQLQAHLLFCPSGQAHWRDVPAVLNISFISVSFFYTCVHVIDFHIHHVNFSFMLRASVFIALSESAHLQRRFFFLYTMCCMSPPFYDARFSAHSIIVLLSGLHILVQLLAAASSFFYYSFVLTFVNVGRQRNKSKSALVCLDFASVVLVEPLPIAPLYSFFKVGSGVQFSQNYISRIFLPGLLKG